MKIRSLRNLCLTMLPLFVSGSLLAQNIVQIESPNLAVESQDADAGPNSQIIFSNFGPTTLEKYDSKSFAKLAVAGKAAVAEPETWVAINFTPKVDVQAQVLLAAITYVSGTKLVNLGLYSDADGEVGSPIPGAQGSTTDIPASGDCCRLAKVTLANSIPLSIGSLLAGRQPR